MDEATLRRAIIEQPQEDAPRLAYAAWCDSQGNKAQGDYIRAQVARARVEPDSPEFDRLFQEEMRALNARTKGTSFHAQEDAIDDRYRVKLGLRHSVFGFDMIRGFVGSMSCRVPDFIAAAGEIFALAPIETVGLQWEGGTAAGESAADPQRLADMTLHRIRDLYLPAELDLLCALKSSPNLGHVRSLKIGRFSWDKRPLDGEAFVTELLAALERGFSGVSQLYLSEIKIGPLGAARLAASPAARRLTQLGLRSANLGDAGAIALTEAGTLHNVEVLQLCDNGITAPGVRALGNAPSLARVKNLDLGKNTINDAGMQALLQRTSMPALARLGIEESVNAKVYEDWIDWTGANIGGDYYMRPMRAADVAKQYPLGVVMYDK